MTVLPRIFYDAPPYVLSIGLDIRNSDRSSDCNNRQIIRAQIDNQKSLRPSILKMDLEPDGSSLGQDPYRIAGYGMAAQSSRRLLSNCHNSTPELFSSCNYPTTTYMSFELRTYQSHLRKMAFLGPNT